MADYAIILARSSQKELASLPVQVINRIALKIDGLVKQPVRLGVASCETRTICGAFVLAITGSFMKSMTLDELSPCVPFDIDAKHMIEYKFQRDGQLNGRHQRAASN